MLLAVARRPMHDGQEALDLDDVGLEDEGVPQRPAPITSKRSALLWQVLTEAYTRLGFDAVDDETFAQLVLARIIGPTSKADSVGPCPRILDTGCDYAAGCSVAVAPAVS